MSSNEVKVGALTLGGADFLSAGWGADAGTCSKVCRRTGWHC